MAGKRIVVQMPDGRTRVRIPAYEATDRPEGDTDEALEQRCLEGLPPGAQVVPQGDIPSDRTFRDAWKINSAKIAVDMPIARQIHMDRIRVERDAELVKRDTLFAQAIEAGNTAEQARIAAEKQILRDIPQTFDLGRYTTPTGLKKAWPVELK